MLDRFAQIELSVQSVYVVSDQAQKRILSMLPRVNLSRSIQAEPADLKVEPAAGQAKRSGGFRDVAAGAIERGLNEVALHVLDRGGKVGRRSRGAD